MIDDGRNFSLIFHVSSFGPHSRNFCYSDSFINICFLLILCVSYPAFYLATTDSIVSHRFPMDSNASGFLLNSVYYQSKEDDGIIDLGLSLRTLQPEAYHPSGGHTVGPEGYGDSIEWPQENLQVKTSNRRYKGIIQEDGGADDEAEGIQSKERWAYLKVNMDGVLVGRKICILDYCGYSSLACQLEDMFGRNSATGLRLFQPGSEFSLVYKDREENWRTVGDVPWKEFVESVKRLMIARN